MDLQLIEDGVARVEVMEKGTAFAVIRPEGLVQ
jgi:hypothetical protein